MSMDARTITRALGGDWTGAAGLIPDVGHSPHDRGLKVWDGPDGRVMVHSFHGYDFREVRDHLKSLGLLDDDGAEASGQRFISADEIKQRSEASAQRNRECALKVWRNAKPAEGTLAETYLRSRGITMPPPRSVRFHPSLKHAPTGNCFPALVAAVQSVDGDIVAVQRIYLNTDGSGKAPVSPAKMTLGPCAGGAVRFSKPQKRLAVGEGIESVLSFMQDTNIPAWAALSTSGLKALDLPDIVQDIIIAADRDDNGAGEIAAEAAAERWVSEGRRVRIALPPNDHNDFNDALRASPLEGKQ